MTPTHIFDVIGIEESQGMVSENIMSEKRKANALEKDHLRSKCRTISKPRRRFGRNNPRPRRQNEDYL